MKSAFTFRRSKSSSERDWSTGWKPHTGDAVATSPRKALCFGSIRRCHTEDTMVLPEAISSVDKDDDVCIICQESLSPVDLTHPLQCTNCTFNCCRDCVESLLNLTHTDEPLATVHCPNCRSDLNRTICDTLLLRTIDAKPEPSSGHERRLDNEAVAHEIAAAREREGQFWERKELRQHPAQPSLLHSPKSVISNYESDVEDHTELDMEDEILEERDVVEKPTTMSTYPQYEEWGLEVDVRTGVHESIKMPFYAQTLQSSRQQPDHTLLAGLDGAMTRSEQETLTRHLISGDPAELATAAAVLAARAAQVQQRHVVPVPSLEPSEAPMEAKDTATPLTDEESFWVTVHRLIEASKRARASRSHQASKPSPEGPRRRDAPYTKLATVKAARHRLVDDELRAKLAFLKRHPLPARLPKYCEFVIPFDAGTMSDAHHIVKCLPFRFCNDTWDGTVRDAFTKLVVHDNRPQLLLPAGKNYAPTPLTYRTFVDHYRVVRRPMVDDGVRHILGSGWGSASDFEPRSSGNSNSGNDVLRVDTPRPRVLIATVVDPKAAKGSSPPSLSLGSVVVPGDVVTHLNGVELRDITVDDLIARICSLCYSATTDEASGSGSTIRLVLNADRAVAKALQMRATTIHNMFYE